MTTKPPSPRTDFPALLSDLSGGVFEQQLNAAISDVAANVVTYGRKGEVNIRLVLKQIGDSNQVALTHSLKYVVPTKRGKIVEDMAADTPLHVCKGGKLVIYPEEQAEMFAKDTAPTPTSSVPH